jgi:hypothetical protein
MSYLKSQHGAWNLDAKHSAIAGAWAQLLSVILFCLGFVENDADLSWRWRDNKKEWEVTAFAQVLICTPPKDHEACIHTPAAVHAINLQSPDRIPFASFVNCAGAEESG